jgi:L,D-transpeptidase-like protein
VTESSRMRVRSPQTIAVAGSVIVMALAATGAGAQALDPAASRAVEAPAQAQTQKALAPAGLKIRLKGASDGDVHVGDRVHVVGRIRPYIEGERVSIVLARYGKTIKELHPLPHRVAGHRHVGAFHMRSPQLVVPGRYHARARHEETNKQRAAKAHTPSFHINYPNLNPGARGGDVALFGNLLDRRGYHVPGGTVYGDGMKRAVLAFRKVNGLPRTFDATAAMFKTLAAGKGGFRLAYPGAGRHVEVDVSRQVMALADGGRAQQIFPVSTGAPATPTIRGHYHFYSRQPGYNDHGMYYSVYWHGGYAVHGYASVPTYNASHGCVREPIPDAVFIYNWIRLGESIYVYD